MVKPPRLRKGDPVALVSVSSPVPSPGHLDRMIRYLESLDLRVVPSVHVSATDGYLAGPDRSRLEDFTEAILSPITRAIFFAWGGKGANHLLQDIPYQSFRDNPKIVVGLSDPSCILNALTVRTDVITFHGPTGVNFSEESGLDPYTRESLIGTLFSDDVRGDLRAHSEWQVLKPGNAAGRLFGGHLSTIQTLLGTPFEPNWDGNILFWEEVGKPARSIDLSLTHFRLAGVFERIAGMIVGRPLGCDDPQTDAEMDLRRTILNLCEPYKFPILFNVDSGHADPKLTLPIGGMVELVLGDGEPRFAISESVVE